MENIKESKMKKQLTIYKYLKLKYDKKLVKEIFEKNGLDKKKIKDISEIKMSGCSTLLCLEIVLSKICYNKDYELKYSDNSSVDIYGTNYIFIDKISEDIEYLNITINDLLNSINNKRIA